MFNQIGGLNAIGAPLSPNRVGGRNIYYQKWSGLTGFAAWFQHIPYYAPVWLANGFTEGRDLRLYTETEQVAASKAAMIEATALGLKCIWGVTAVNLTAANWGAYRAAILDAATWAQANGIFEFQLGNELESQVDGVTLTRSQLYANLKDVAEDVQAIYTIGNVSYSCLNSYISEWIAGGKGDYIDILASNVYIEYGAHYAEPWKDMIDDLIGAFGIDGTYLTEFGPNSSGLDYYSTDEAVQAAGVTEMIDYIKASGIKRALFYTWWGDDFGVVKNDESYRELWASLLGSQLAVGQNKLIDKWKANN